MESIGMGLELDLDSEETVHVPFTDCRISEQQMNELTDLVDPLQLSDDYGISLYILTRDFINDCIML